MGYNRKRVKKGECNQLSAEQKAINKAINTDVVVIEHDSAGIKRYRILVNQNRLEVAGLLDRLLGSVQAFGT